MTHRPPGIRRPDAAGPLFGSARTRWTLAAHSAELRQGAWLIFIPAKKIFHFRRRAVQSFPPGYHLNR